MPDRSPASIDWQSVHRVLVVRLDNIGDVVMLGPALRSLRGALPNAEIVLLASPGGGQVAPMLPWVDDVITWRAVWQDISGAIQLDPERELSLVRLLKDHQFDAAWIFTSFSQSPYPPAYACYLAGVPIRIGHSKEFGGGLLTLWAKPPGDEGHQVDRNLALVEKTGVPILGRELELWIPLEVEARVDSLLMSTGLHPNEPYILLAPGASCSARRYDPLRYAAVACKLVQKTGLPLVIVGSEREAETLAPVTALVGVGPIYSLVGRTTVLEFAALVERSSLVIANNSASLHIADAFRRPLVILYSGTERESEWMPRSAPARLLRRETDCSPCRNFRCPYGMECLDISPQEVVAAALDLLADQGQVALTPAKSLSL